MQAPRSEQTVRMLMSTSGYWYDFSVKITGQADYSRRFAGCIETCQASFTHPAMFGSAIGDQLRVG